MDSIIELGSIINDFFTFLVIYFPKSCKCCCCKKKVELDTLGNKYKNFIKIHLKINYIDLKNVKQIILDI